MIFHEASLFQIGLAAEDNQFVTGAVIDVDGGFSLGIADHERA